jgi:hypothetical protein
MVKPSNIRRPKTGEGMGVRVSPQNRYTALEGSGIISKEKLG